MTVVEHHSADELLRLHLQARCARLARRIRIVWQARLGRTEPQITADCGMSRRSVQEQVRRCNEGGLDALGERPGRGRKPILDDDERRRVAEWVGAGPGTDDVCSLRGLDCQKFIQETFGKRMSLSAVYELLHGLGLSWLSPRPKHRKADPAAAEEFKKSPRGAPPRPGGAPGREGRGLLPGRMPLRPAGDVEPRLGPPRVASDGVKQLEYQYSWVVAAASLQTGQAEAILSPVLNAFIINQSLRQFSESLPEGTHAALIWDGAGYHRSKSLVVPANVTLIQLPPYSPELNGIENLWHWLRSHCWSNRIFADYDALFDAAERDWLRYGLDTELIRSVCRKPWLESAEV